MPAFVNRVLSALIGDDRRFSLEQRLFNTLSLLNGSINILGAPGAFALTGSRTILALHLITGVGFLAFYYLSRQADVFRALYWPFVLLTLSFVWINTLENAGTMGGAHYYFIPALMIALMLSESGRVVILGLALFLVAAACFLGLEHWLPEWIVRHGSANERALDVAGNLLFVMALAGGLVVVLSRSLNRERRKSDRLLANVLPASIARELKENDCVLPRQYESASVLFTDFVGFTHIAEQLLPHELIEALDGWFRQLDRIARRHRLEKIKTIGDSYMAVGGIPEANATHAVDCVLAALEMSQLEAVGSVVQSYKWQLRLGIHTGSLIAGVIGREKFAYDVWGDTVNTASRLESSGHAGQVNISQATYDCVKEFFLCEHRGKVAAKNKGGIDMYFVLGLRPELAEAGSRCIPNARFHERYAALAMGHPARHVLPAGWLEAPAARRKLQEAL